MMEQLQLILKMMTMMIGNNFSILRLINMLYYLSHLFLEDINQNGFMLDKYRIILIEIMRCNNFIRNKTSYSNMNFNNVILLIAV